MAINCIDWRAQRQQQLIAQWLIMNTVAIITAMVLWPYLKPMLIHGCASVVPGVIPTLPIPTPIPQTAPQAARPWPTEIASILQQWPTIYQLDTLTWRGDGIRLAGQCRHHCNITALLHFCEQSHSQLTHIHWHHKRYDFGLYHAHTISLP